MKVLVDTCVWSLALRRRRTTLLNAEERELVARLEEAVRDGNVVMIGPVRQEVLSGIKDEPQFLKTARLLEPFPDEEPHTGDFVEAARLFNLCRSQGVQCGPVDMLICAIAVTRRCLVLTNDRGLLRCVDVLKKSKLLSSARS